MKKKILKSTVICILITTIYSTTVFANKGDSQEIKEGQSVSLEATRPVDGDQSSYAPNTDTNTSHTTNPENYYETQSGTPGSPVKVVKEYRKPGQTIITNPSNRDYASTDKSSGTFTYNPNFYNESIAVYEKTRAAGQEAYYQKIGSLLNYEVQYYNTKEKDGSITKHIVYIPSTYMNIQKDTVEQETSRVTDYYRWILTTPSGRQILWNGGYVESFTANYGVGNYKIEAIPHQQVSENITTTYTSMCYAYYSDTTTEILKDDSYKETSTNNYEVLREDLKRVWNFYMTAKEVGPNKIITPDEDPSKDPRNVIEVEWEVELIQ